MLVCKCIQVYCHAGMKWSLSILTGTIVFLIFNCPANAQIRNSSFSNYTIQDGLSDDKIHCIFQDTQGWIWIGSSFGVLRFDGYEFHKFHIDSEESEILDKSLIRTIYEDRNQRIWIGTENHGLFKYDRSVYGLEHISKRGKTKNLCNNSIWAIAEDAKGLFWIGTENGLNRYDPVTGKLQSYFHDPDNPESLSDNFIRTLYIDHAGYLWIGTNNGITRLNTNDNTFQRFLTEKTTFERESEVWEIYEDAKNQIWAGTYLGGLKKFDKKLNRFQNVSLESVNDRSNTVRAIVQDRNRNLWIGTRAGLFRLNSKDYTVTYFAHDDMDENSLVHNSVLELFIDRKGDLWVGTRDGISHLNFDKQAFGNLTIGGGNNKGLNNSEIYAFWEGGLDDIWIGTENGGINIYNYKKKDISYITTANGLSNNCIKAFCYDNKNTLYIGTYLGGLNIYNLKTGVFEYRVNDPEDTTSLSDNAVWTILCDSKDRIWLGTDDGLDLYDPVSGKFTHYGEKYGVSMVVMVYEDSRGRLWIYSENIKLTMVDTDEKIRDFPYKTRAICDDKYQNIWIGTLGNGLIRFDIENNSSVVYTTREGLCNNIIYGIINENDNYLWISTKNGISRYDIHSNSFKNYFNSDGLLNSQYNYGAFLMENDQTLVFGGGKGVDFIFLNQLGENKYIPNIVFTDFKVFNNPVPIVNESGKKNTLSNLICETKQIILEYDQNMLSFEFAALNYANSEKNMYEYRLEGFDKDWNRVGNQRRATYTNLDPGNYTLHVVGSNNDNVFNTEGTSLQITILPPFWKTIWFRILILFVLLFLGYCVYLFISNREKLKNQLLFERESARKVQELERLKHQFFMNISHEIRTPLSLILGPLDKLLKFKLTDEERHSHLEIIQRSAMNLKKLVNQLLDYRKLETGNIKLELKKGNISRFMKEIYDSFKDMASERKIQLNYKSVQDEIPALFDPDKIEKIINNLLSNAFKYTEEGGTISLSISTILVDEIDENNTFIPVLDKKNSKHGKFLQIIVRDTGIGIPSNQINKIFNRFVQVKGRREVYRSGGTGIGLSLTKELIKIHNGFIQVKSKEGKGSRFKVLIPLIEYEEELTTMIKPENTEEQQNLLYSMQNEVVIKDVPDKNDNNNKRVLLIVDDNPDIRLFIKHHFEPEYAVIEGRNGRDGWEKTLETIPDIIVADIMMPVMNGKEFCRKIKKDERTSHIPVVLLTALHSNENQIAGIDAGADDYITKPFDISLLKARVDNMLYIRKALRERYSKEMVLKPKEIVLSSPDEKFLKRVINVIEKNIDNIELDVDSLSQQIGVSRTQLYRKIAALTDMSAKEFVRDIRLKRATQLIVQDKLTISEIALKTGFNDISYFRKCFKEKYGMSASEFLKVGHTQKPERSTTKNHIGA